MYGLLHSPDYRTAYAADLKRMLPRIPMVASADDFRAFADAGRKLADLHIGYETVEPWPLEISGEPASSVQGDALYDWYRVEKMRFGGTGKEKDRSTVIYNSHITVSGIPDEAYEYMLGSRSGVEWVMERYQVKVDKASQIKNDPNDWSREVEDPRYILDLLGAGGAGECGDCAGCGFPSTVEARRLSGRRRMSAHVGSRELFDEARRVAEFEDAALSLAAAGAIRN